MNLLNFSGQIFKIQASFNSGNQLMQSMTAFANQEIETPLGKITCEIKSVNQRFLDLTIKSPDFMRRAEEQLRKIFKNKISRGKISVFIRFYPNPDVNLNELKVNQSVLRQLQNCAREIQDGLKIADGDMTVSDYMNWSDVIIQSPTDTSSLQDFGIQLVKISVDDLIASRLREGEQMCAVLEEKILLIEKMTHEIRLLMPAINRALADKLNSKLADMDFEVNPERFEQEIALQLLRIDIGEELDRLDAHVFEVKRVLKLTEPVGRRLDFLVQELNRESNTVGSKSASIKTSNASIDLKVAIEQMREQIQNIE
ncbi:MAG: YicC family protein [Proteobacteria bacterium]|nr:YicC family protein [Pseudomonadota bacterium]